MNNKFTMIFTIAVFAVLLVKIGFSLGLEKEVQENMTCSGFASQPQAQAVYDKDPVKWARLDGRDQDKKVCESLPKNARK